ncbi:tetratricopeptide repeat protein [Streptomyces aureus]
MSRKRRPARRQPTPVQRTDAQQAEELEALARKYPQDQEELLIEAAEFYSRAGQHDKALALYQQILDAHCEEPHLVQAFRVNTLWDAGRTDEAREAATDLRCRHPTDTGPWNIVAEMFEAADELHDAADWFTAAVTHLLGPTTPSPSTPSARRWTPPASRCSSSAATGYGVASASRTTTSTNSPTPSTTTARPGSAPPAPWMTFTTPSYGPLRTVTPRP